MALDGALDSRLPGRARLVLSRALVEIFDLPEARDALAFRGGTALYKLHLTPPARYSEDIDLVHAGRRRSDRQAARRRGA